MSDNYKDYADLFGTSHKGYKSVPPEEEFFKSVYIGGQDRKNHIGIVESANKLHIRGHAYNLDKVTFMITHIKNVLVKNKRDEKSGKETVECFSYQNEFPSKGTSGRTCGSNSAERAAVEFCSPCRSNLIVSGIYCDESGNPFADDKSQPVRIFIRARGMKYTGVRSYLDKLATADIEPSFFANPDAKAKEIERTLINNKRYVTVLTIGDAPTKSYGIKKVFDLSSGNKVERKITEGVLNDAKKTLKEFNEKFDWSKNKTAVGYSEDAGEDELVKTPPDASQTFESPKEESKPVEQKVSEAKQSEKPKEQPKAKTISFEDINF